MKEKIQPIDLVHIQDKALAIRHNLERIVSDRSDEMKSKALKNAISIIETMIRDIDYLFDTKTFDGRRGLGLDD